jgi:hypothetical protein
LISAKSFCPILFSLQKAVRKASIGVIVERWPAS